SGGHHGKRSDAGGQGKKETEGRQGQAQAALRLQTGSDAGLVREPLQRSTGQKTLTVNVSRTSPFLTLPAIPWPASPFPGRSAVQRNWACYRALRIARTRRAGRDCTGP